MAIATEWPICEYVVARYQNMGILKSEPGKEMLELFSPRTRASTWRQLWVWLAESQMELGLPISDVAIHQLRQNVRVTDHDFEVAAAEEKKRRHDVMAAVHGK